MNITLSLLKLRQIANNVTEIQPNNQTSIMYSYETPVAIHAFVDGKQKAIRSNEYYKGGTTPTTSKHINHYFWTEWNIKREEVEEVNNEEFQRILNSI
jgi:hypothetical protein|tara:strand:+ start:1277 stop:1570 length:294 start_codon:yes stop_codon:yes gene_type:complete